MARSAPGRRDDPPGLPPTRPAAAGGRRRWSGRVLLDYLTGCRPRAAARRRGASPAPVPGCDRRRGAAVAALAVAGAAVGLGRLSAGPTGGRGHAGGCCGCRSTGGAVPAGAEVGVPRAWRRGGSPNATTSTGSTPRWSCPRVDPRQWRLRIHGMVDREVELAYQRPAAAAAHRGLGDDLLRLQPGRRRPDRQRLVERGADRRPARGGRRAARRRRGQADLAGRLDLRHPARRRSPTTATRCWPSR